jgi:hypothetical protein
MNNKEKQIEGWLLLFNGYRSADEMFAKKNGSTLVFDEEYVDKTIKKISDQYHLEEDEINTLKRRIVSSYEIFQEEGDALLDDYSHVDWYISGGEGERPYWDRYFQFLVKKNPEFGNSENKLDFNTDAITNLLGDPKANGTIHVRGLVMGDVQSGKTATYIGLICKAVDAGYKVIILLTGTTESLRRQTQSRVDEGFIGFDSEKQIPVGVGINSTLDYPRVLTSTLSDYKGFNIAKNTTGQISKLDSVPLVLVCKKNTKILKKIIYGLRALNTSAAHKRIDAPLLLVDDEADNASINTNKPEEDPTIINGNIRALLALFKQSSYVGFTATPFANVFIQPNTTDEMENDDLFPKDFIYSLKAPSNYVSPISLFTKNGSHRGCLVDLDDDIANQGLFSYSHKKDWDGGSLFPSFYEAIITFCLANTIRDLRGDINAHRSMMINMSRFIDVQKKIADITETFYKDIKTSARLFGKQPESLSLANPMMSLIHKTWMKQYDGKVSFTWNDISKNLYTSISDIKIVAVNSKSTTKLNYDDYKSAGLRVIAVGGLALSRGLTLEGLVTSYFYRNTSTYDVLMQMGRWFGYRPNYDDIMRVWIPRCSSNWYREIAEAIEEMKSDIRNMIAKKKTPLEFGIRVRDDSEDLGITSTIKMRNAVNRLERNSFSFYGSLFESTFVTQDFKENEKNWELVDALSLKLPKPDPSVQKPYFRNVDKGDVLDLISKIKLPRFSVQFDQDQIVKFLTETKDPSLEKWDVLFATKDKNDDNDDDFVGGTKKIVLPNGLIITPIKRTCIASGNSIEVSGGKSHIGSRDTKYGLSKEQIQIIEDKRKADGGTGTSQKMYINNVARNPLLIIYAISPNISNFDLGQRFAKENYDLLLNSPRGAYVAISVGISSSDGSKNKESHLYKVNKDADYFSKFGFQNEGKESIEE